jgi:hypothetical protein
MLDGDVTAADGGDIGPSDAGSSDGGADTPATSDAPIPACEVTARDCDELAAAVAVDPSTERTVCLEAGSYGDCTLADVDRSQPVHLVPVPGATVSMSLRLANVHFVYVDGAAGELRLAWVGVLGAGDTAGTCSTHVRFSHLTMEPNGTGMLLDGHTCPSTPQDIVVDDVDFVDVGQAVAEGRLSIRDGNGIHVTHSTFAGVATELGASGPSDGIQIFGGGGSSDIHIGPGNVFRDIHQSECDAFGGAHCDSIQFYASPCGAITIEGNLFEDVSTLILNESPCTTTIRSNVFRRVAILQGHCWTGGSFDHNTFYESSVRLNGITATFPIRSNIFDGSDYVLDAVAPERDGCPTTACTGCEVSHSLQTGGCSGASCISGSPTYEGGDAPASWAGFRLASGSLGRGDGHDGADRGTLYYGP